MPRRVTAPDVEALRAALVKDVQRSMADDLDRPTIADRVRWSRPGWVVGTVLMLVRGMRGELAETLAAEEALADLYAAAADSSHSEASNAVSAMSIQLMGLHDVDDGEPTTTALTLVAGELVVYYLGGHRTDDPDVETALDSGWEGWLGERRGPTPTSSDLAARIERLRTSPRGAGVSPERRAEIADAVVAVCDEVARQWAKFHAHFASRRGPALWLPILRTAREAASRNPSSTPEVARAAALLAETTGERVDDARSAVFRMATQVPWHTPDGGHVLEGSRRPLVTREDLLACVHALVGLHVSGGVTDDAALVEVMASLRRFDRLSSDELRHFQAHGMPGRSRRRSSEEHTVAALADIDAAWARWLDVHRSV